MSRRLIASAVVVLSAPLLCQAPASGLPAKAPASTGPVPLVFLANTGQWPSDARFATRHRSFAAQFHRDSIWLVRERRDEKPLGVAVRLGFVGTDGSEPVVAEASAAHVHSFVGSREHWRSDMPAATALRYPELWPGVDLVVHDCQGELEYDVELQPWADLSAVALCCDGGEVELQSDGSLVVHTELGDLRQHAPRTWEVANDGAHVAVPCRFALRSDGSYGFLVERRDASRKLVVDPVIVWATYFGGTGDDLAYGLDVFPNGQVVVCGQTSSTPVFPATPGSYQPSLAPGSLYDGFVARLDPSVGGTGQLLWCTYFGAEGDDYINRVAIGPSGDIAFLGHTTSGLLPTTPGALRTFSGGGPGDAFVGVLSGNGATLLYSTYLGGAGDEFLQDIVVEANGWIDVAGYVTGVGMPVSAGAFQTTHQGGTYDGYVARLDRALVGSAQLRWGTYFGNSQDNLLYDIALSPVLPGIITCCGYSLDPGGSGHGAIGGFQLGPRSAYDAMIVQFDPTLAGAAQKRMSTFTGGTGGSGCNEFGYAVAVEANGDLVLAGLANSGQIPTTVGAFRTSTVGNPTLTDGFLMKIAANGASIRYCTYIGATNSGLSGDIAPWNLSVDASGRVTIGGYTNWLMPVTAGAVRSTLSGYEGFVSRFDASLTQLLYCTYVGGNGEDIISNGGMHLSGDVATICMRTRSTDLPVRNPYQGAYQQGLRDGYLIRIDLAANGAGASGAPGFRTATQPVGTGPHGVALGDLDGDGDRDIVTSNLGSDDLSLLRNDGLGGFATAATAIALGAGNIDPSAVAIGDFDGDGAADDLAVACSTSNSLVYVQNAASTPVPTALVTSGQRPVHLAAGNLNGNATTDLVIAHEGTTLVGGGGLGLALDGAAPVAVPIPPGRATSLTRVGLADLDGDGDLDVAAVAHGTTDEVLLWSNSGGVLTFAGFLPMTSSNSLGAGLALVDIDGDGDRDIVVAQPVLLTTPTQTLRIFRYVGGGALDAGDYAQTFDVPMTGAIARALAGSDLEHDRVPGFAGGTDIIVVNSGSSPVQGLYGFQPTTGLFAGSGNIAAGTGPADLALADLDADGTIDVVLTNEGANTVTIHRTDPAFARTFGTGCTSPTHLVPAISALVPPRIGQQFTVELTNALPNAAALLGFAFAPQTTPLGGPCTLYLDLSFTTSLHLCDSLGHTTDVQTLPNQPSLLGLQGFFQWGALDPAGPFQNLASFSNALWVQVGS